MPAEPATLVERIGHDEREGRIQTGYASERDRKSEHAYRGDDPAEGEKKAKGTGGGEHKTGVAGRRPVGKGR